MKLFKSKILSIVLLTIGFLTLNNTQSTGQCDVSANVFPQTICSGDNITLSATGGCGILMLNTFNNGTIGTGWSSTAANPVFTNPCGPGKNGAHLWVGTTNSQTRTLTAVNYDVSIGSCSVNWWMRYSRELSSGGCEDPDTPNEGVHLQYSINNGTTWTNFPGPDLEPIGPNSTTQPFNTTTPGSGGYWAPPASGTHNGNSPPIQTIYYWHEYESDVPVIASTNNTKFRWAQLSTTNQGYDAWGIDEVEIKCPTGNTNKIWSHGPTQLNPPPVTLPSIGNSTYDTCFIITISDSINSATDTVCVTVNPTPTSNFSASSSKNCQGDSIVFKYTGNASTSGSYNWDINGNNPFSGQGPHTHIFNSPGRKIYH